MSVAGFSRHKHLDELDDPLQTGEGWLTPAQRRARVVANLGITATAAELNAVADGASTAAAVTATSDGLTTGLIPAGTRVVIITSANAAHIATLPGVADNDLPIGYTIYGRVAATGCEIRTPASSNETINGVDADSSEMALAANEAFTAVVEAADGWLISVGAATVPD